MTSDPSWQAGLSQAIQLIVHQDVLGRVTDCYNVDTLAVLAAGIDSSQYATLHMAQAPRFASKLTLHDHAVSLAPPAGLILEFGVYSGATINALARRFPGRRLYGFDSFEGLPEAWRPGFAEGTFRTALPAVEDNVELVVGWFDAVLPGFAAAHPDEPLALLHVDCDLYSSTRTIFDIIGDRIRAGTIIVFDEYFNYPEWRLHEFKAFQEFVAARAVTYRYTGLIPIHQQVCVEILSVGDTDH